MGSVSNLKYIMQVASNTAIVKTGGSSAPDSSSQNIGILHPKLFTLTIDVTFLTVKQSKNILVWLI